MADLLGICTQYHQHEVAHAAVFLADQAHAAGLDVAIRAERVCLKEVTPYWDARVQRDRECSLLDWLDRCDRVLWTRCPAEMDVHLAQDAGVETWILAVWDELSPKHVPALVAADHVLCPYACVAEALRRASADTGRVTLPWIAPVPVSQHLPREDGRIRAAIPLFDSQPQRNDGSIFTLIHDLLAEVPELDITVGQGRGWAQASRRALKELKRVHGDRLLVMKRPKYLRRISFYASADVMIWPSQYEGLALPGLWAAALGTPVVTWKAMPQLEYLRQDRNGVLVPCSAEKNWLGVPEVVPDYPVFLRHAVSLLRDPARLGKMHCRATDGMQDRKARFTISWRNLLGG